MSERMHMKWVQGVCTFGCDKHALRANNRTKAYGYNAYILLVRFFLSFMLQNYLYQWILFFFNLLFVFILLGVRLGERFRYAALTTAQLAWMYAKKVNTHTQFINNKWLDLCLVDAHIICAISKFCSQSHFILETRSPPQPIPPSQPIGS